MAIKTQSILVNSFFMAGSELEVDKGIGRARVQCGKPRGDHSQCQRQKANTLRGDGAADDVSGSRCRQSAPKQALPPAVYRCSAALCAVCSATSRQAGGTAAEGHPRQRLPGKRPKRCRPVKMYRRGVGTRRSGVGLVLSAAGVRAFPKAAAHHAHRPTPRNVMRRHARDRLTETRPWYLRPAVPAAARAAERDIDVVRKPPRQADVPAAPEITQESAR